jgi:hypothetical protein
MAIFTRTSGDANGVVHVDVAAGTGVGSIVGFIGRKVSVFKLDTGSVDISDQTGVGGAVEAILRAVAVESSIIAYQVENDSSGEMRVMVDATGFDAAGLQVAVRALGTVNGANLGSTTVTAVGLKS